MQSCPKIPGLPGSKTKATVGGPAHGQPAEVGTAHSCCSKGRVAGLL